MESFCLLTGFLKGMEGVIEWMDGWVDEGKGGRERGMEV